MVSSWIEPTPYWSINSYFFLYQQDCPEGFYCPEGTGHVWQSCPLGTFSNQTGLSNETQCTQCTFGFYCDQLNATSESGKWSSDFCQIDSWKRICCLYFEVYSMFIYILYSFCEWILMIFLYFKWLLLIICASKLNQSQEPSLPWYVPIYFWMERSMFSSCLTQGHKCHNRDTNPHSAEQNTRAWVQCSYQLNLDTPNWFIDCLIGLLIDWLIDLLINLFNNWLMDLPIGYLIN